MPERFPNLRRNDFAFVIEAEDGVLLGASSAGVIAYAMYRAALDEHSGRTITLKEDGRVLAERY